MIVDYLPSVLRWFDSGFGRIALIVLGFCIIGFQLYRQDRKLQRTDTAGADNPTPPLEGAERPQPLGLVGCALAQQNEPEPKIEIIFKNEPPYYTPPKGGTRLQPPPPQEIEVNIGVENKTEETIHGLRVRIEKIVLDGKPIVDIPLQEINDSPPYKLEFTLHSGLVRYFRVLRQKSDGPVTICGPSDTNYTLPMNTADYVYEFNIVASGDNAPARRKVMTVKRGFRWGWVVYCSDVSRS